MKKAFFAAILVLTIALSAFLFLQAWEKPKTNYAVLQAPQNVTTGFSCDKCQTMIECLACLDKKIVDSISKKETESLEVETYVVEITYDLVFENTQKVQEGSKESTNLGNTWNAENTLQNPAPFKKEETADGKIASEIFVLINAQRKKYGLSPLIENPNLKALSEQHSQNMGLAGSLVHSSTYPAEMQAWAENIAYVPKDYYPAQVAVIDWMRSSGHRANILGPYRYTGIGVTCSDNYTVNYCYLTQQFGA